MNFKNLPLEKAEGQGLINWHRCTNSEINRGNCSKQEDRHCNRATEWVLELVETLDKWNQHQTEWNQGLQGNTKQFIWNNTQNLKHRVQIPLRKDFKRGGEGIGFIPQHRRIKNGKAYNAGNGSEDDDRKDVKKIVGPSRLTVIVMPHPLSELGSHLGI